MNPFTRSFTNVTAAADSCATAGPLRRLWSVDPLILAFMIAAAALIAMFCIFALAEMVTLFGAEAVGAFLRDAGQQVGGAGGLGAAGAGAAGAASGGSQQSPSATSRREDHPIYREFLEKLKRHQQREPGEGIDINNPPTAKGYPSYGSARG